MRLVLALAAFTAASIAVGQTVVPSFVLNRSSGAGLGRAWATAEVRVGIVAVVRGAPFSGEETQRGTQVMPNGKFALPMPAAKVYRHSDGRTRREHSIGTAPPGMAGDAFDVVELNDPAAGVYYLLDKSKKIAHRVQYKPAVAPKDYAPTVLPPEGTTRSQEGAEQVVTSLGKRQMQGVEVEGRRISTTLPARAGVVEREVWASTQAHVAILSTLRDPRGGETIFEMKGLSLDNPKSDLFSRPGDYKVVLEQSPFTVEFGERPANIPLLRPPPSGSGPYVTGDMRRPGGEGEPAVYKIGGPVIAPVPLFRTDAGFSAAMKEAGVQGTVTLSMVVDAQGVPRDITVSKGLQPDLDQKAVEDVSKWRFRPGTKDGEAVAVQATVEFRVGK